ncbi:MAG: amino acid permease [Thermoproteota archaeon]|nr:amino acid permease [Thermoproteota archaeon]
MKRELGLFSAVIIGLSGAIGFEVFVLLDYAYLRLAGPGMVLALLLGGLINLLIMLSYCELSAAIPEVGGEYTYTKAAYGGFVAFMSGCLRWLASVFGAALAALTFTQQLSYLFSKVVPAVEGVISAQTPLIAMIVVVILAALEVRGVKKVGAIIVTAFLALFAVFVASGFWHGLTSPQVFPKLLPDGFLGVFAATAYMYPMFFGMRALVAGAVQIKEPEKNIPRAILLSALLMIPIYFSIAYVTVGVVSQGDAYSPLVNFAAEKIMGVPGGVLFGISGMVASLSALGTSIFVQSSIACGMSRDGYLPKILLSIHQRFGTPYIAVIAGSSFIMFLSSIGAVEFFAYAASFGSILVFALVNLSLLRLREKKPYLKRPFKAPLYPFTPIAGFVMSIVLLAFPMFLGDVNAISALTSGLGLMGLVLAIYYLKMVGRYRLRVAVGGISLGIGVFVGLLACLIEIGFVPLVLSPVSFYFLIFISVLSILAGVLNVTTRTPKIF